MGIGYEVTTPLVAPLVTVDEFKAYARIVGRDGETAVIEDLLMEAEDYVCDRTNHFFQTRTVKFTLDRPPAQYGGWRVPQNTLFTNRVDLPAGPVVSVQSITIFTDGALRTLDPASYQVDTTQRVGRVAPRNGQYWPFGEFFTLSTFTVNFTAGYANPALVPRRAKNVIKRLAIYWYENREPGATQNVVGTVPLSLDRQIDNLKIMGWA